MFILDPNMTQIQLIPASMFQNSWVFHKKIGGLKGKPTGFYMFLFPEPGPKFFQATLSELGADSLDIVESVWLNWKGIVWLVYIWIWGMIQLDSYFSDGLKPPIRYTCIKCTVNYMFLYLYIYSTHIFLIELNIIQMDGFRTIMKRWKGVVICCNPL